MTVPVSAAIIGGRLLFAISNAIWYHVGYRVIMPVVGHIKFVDPLTPAIALAYWGAIAAYFGCSGSIIPSGTYNVCPERSANVSISAKSLNMKLTML